MAEPDKDLLEQFPPKRILVPMDFSEPSLAALATAQALGLRWVSQLELIHVSDDTPPGLVQGADAPRELRRLEDYFRSVKARLRELAGDYPAFQVTLEDGYPKSELAELAAAGSADWIVMGTRGRAGLAHMLLGSVAETVVRAARVPVLTVHARPPADWPRRILVPMNLTAYADAALRYGLRLAESVGAAVTILHVEPELLRQRRASEELEKRLGALLSSEKRARLGRIVALGTAPDMILRAVERERFDMIVLAAHKKPFWESLVLGTTAERVLRHARVPVLSVPSVGVAEAPPAAEPFAEPAVRVWK